MLATPPYIINLALAKLTAKRKIENKKIPFNCEREILNKWKNYNWKLGGKNVNNI